MNGPPTMAKTTGQLPLIARLVLPLLGLFFLVYPIGTLFGSDPTPARVFFGLGGAALFAAVFVWLMWTREPLQLGSAESADVLKVRVAVVVLAGLAGLLSFVGGPEWRMLFFYHLNVAAGIMLFRRDAYAVIAAIVLLTFILGLFSGFAFLAAPAAAIGLWSVSFVAQVAAATQLRAAREELARLAVSEERLRFARDLHDLLGHSLSLIALKSELVERLIPNTPENERAAGELRELQGVARGALKEVREAVSGYRQPSLGGELAGAREMLEAAGIECRIEGGVGPLPKPAEAVLAWTVREGVTNVIRHSRAERCSIRLARRNTTVRAEVVDDGRGPSSTHRGGDLSAGGSGLSGLAERVAGFAGAAFEAGPRSEGGFGMSVVLPLADRPVANAEDGRR